MHSSVCEKSSEELDKVHKILSEYHKENFGCYISAVKEKAIPFLGNYKKQRELYQTKIHLFNLKHPANLSEEESAILSELTKTLDSINTLIDKVENGIDMVEKLNNIASVLDEKASQKNLNLTYDDDPKPALTDYRPPLTG